MDDNRHHSTRQEEITLRDVVLAVRGHISEIFSSFSLLVIFVLLGVVTYMGLHFTHQTTYTASCTFMVNEKDQSIGFGSILGEIGIPGRSEFKLEKIAELAKTRTMAANVLLVKVKNEAGEVDYLANHFIQMLKESSEWVEDPMWGDKNPLTDFRFEHDSTAGFDRLSNKALQKVHGALKDRLETNINEITGILEFKLTCADEVMAYEILNGLYGELSDYYTDKSIEKQKSTYDALAFKCDSLKSILDTKEYALASFKDKNRGQWLNIERTPEDKLYREIRMLSIMYGEALKNKEVAAFSLANVRPFIQVIDQPIYPLKKNQSIWWLKFIKGLVVGGITGAAIIVLRKIYRDAMAP